MIDDRSSISFASLTLACPELTHITYQHPDSSSYCMADMDPDPDQMLRHLSSNQNTLEYLHISHRSRLTSIDLFDLTNIGDQVLDMIMPIPTLRCLGVPFTIRDQERFIKTLNTIEELSLYSVICLSFLALEALGNLPLLKHFMYLTTVVSTYLFPKKDYCGCFTRVGA
ncbi:hypothetical protein BJV82DRAFT_573584 [Fennellomyces sp. T-0311]|nr:hypothetical protein BJV82DRAFT_573584 [Fennellomyces sp. T-0311]